MKGVTEYVKEGKSLTLKEKPRKVKISLCWIQTAFFGVCAIKSLVVFNFEKVLDIQSSQRMSILPLTSDRLSRTVTGGRLK